MQFTELSVTSTSGVHSTCLAGSVYVEMYVDNVRFLASRSEL